MKKSVILLTSLLLLASCGTSSDSSSSSSFFSSSDKVVKQGDNISVQYTGRLEDGTIFDSSREEDAKKSKNYTPERKYGEPLTFTVGAGQMIAGFDKGVVGMKVGEKKTITMEPKDAYGEHGKEETIPLKYLQDKFTEEVKKDEFQGTLTKDVPLSALTSMVKEPKVGAKVPLGQVEATIKAIKGDTATLEVIDAANPFRGKALKVGLSGEYQGAVATVKKVNKDTVLVEIDNKQNPFLGKKIEKGATATVQGGQSLVIKDIKKDTAVVEVRMELTGKKLTFDVELVSINEPKTTDVKTPEISRDAEPVAADQGAKTSSVAE